MLEDVNKIMSLSVAGKTFTSLWIKRLVLGSRLLLWHYCLSLQQPFTYSSMIIELAMPRP